MASYRALAHIDTLSNQLVEVRRRHMALATELHSCEENHERAKLKAVQERADWSATDWGHQQALTALTQELQNAHDAGVLASACQYDEHTRTEALQIMMEQKSMCEEHLRSHAVLQIELEALLHHKIGQLDSEKINAQAELEQVQNQLQGCQLQVCALMLLYKLVACVVSIASALFPSSS